MKLSLILTLSLLATSSFANACPTTCGEIKSQIISDYVDFSTSGLRGAAINMNACTKSFETRIVDCGKTDADTAAKAGAMTIASCFKIDADAAENAYYSSATLGDFAAKLAAVAKPSCR